MFLPGEGMQSQEVVKIPVKQYPRVVLAGIIRSYGCLPGDSRHYVLKNTWDSTNTNGAPDSITVLRQVPRRFFFWARHCVCYGEVNFKLGLEGKYDLQVCIHGKGSVVTMTQIIGGFQEHYPHIGEVSFHCVSEAPQQVISCSPPSFMGD